MVIGSPIMSVLNYQVRLTECEELVLAMTGKLGLTAALSKQQQAAETLEQAVYLCLSCKKTEQCIDWLTTHANAGEAPDYCRNRDLFDNLAD